MATTWSWRDQAQRLLLADLRIALMIGLVELDLGGRRVSAGPRSRRLAWL